MAIVYFRRAVRLNRHDHSAWILLGHEYVELNNCSMAIEAYCRGVGEWSEVMHDREETIEKIKSIQVP